MGATIIDGLDTLIIMGLQDEANDAIEWIEHNLSFNQVLLRQQSNDLTY